MKAKQDRVLENRRQEAFNRPADMKEDRGFR